LKPRPPTPALETLPETQRLLLESICVLGEAEVENLAGRCFLSAPACRGQLQSLTARGLIESRPRRDGQVGRPTRVYRLTDEGKTLFPRGEVFTLLAILDVLKEQDPGAYERVWEGLPGWFTPHVIGRAALADASFLARCQFALQFMRQYGHIVSSDRPGRSSTEFVVHHCAVLDVSRLHHGICDAELEWFRRLFAGSNVQFSARQSTGAPACVFRISSGIESEPSVSALSRR
jgi:predicted ArsR family transcriptional regulator